MTTIIYAFLGYFFVGLLVMAVSAYETAVEFCEFKTQSPAQPVQIQFSNLYYQLLAWPGVLIVKFVQWQYSDRLKASAAAYTREVQLQQAKSQTGN